MPQQTTTHTTGQLYTAIKANNDAALQQFYHNNYYKTEQYILHNNGSAEQAKDVYQEAFIAVWRNIQLGRFNAENDNALEAYLLKIAKNKWIDYLRSVHHKNIIAISHAEVDNSFETVNESEHEFIHLVKKKL